MHFQTDWNPLPMISLELTMVRKASGSALSVQMLLYIHQPGDDAVCGGLIQRLCLRGGNLAVWANVISWNLSF